MPPPPRASLAADPAKGATLWATLTIFAVAFGINFLLSFCANHVDMERRQQIRVQKFETACYRLDGHLDAARNDKTLGGLKGELAYLDRQLHEVRDYGGAVDTRSLAATYPAFRTKAAAIIEVLEAARRPGVAPVDLGETESALRGVLASLASIGNRAEAEADRWTRVGGVLSVASCLLAAGLLSLTFARYRRKVRAYVSTEADRRLMESNARRFRTLLQNTSDVIAVTDERGYLKLISDAVEREWGVSTAMLQGTVVFQQLHPKDIPALNQALANVAEGRRAHETVEVRIHKRTGGYLHCEVDVANLLQDPDIAGLLLTFHDVTERKRFMDELAHYAFHDRLTGLPNRSLFLDRLNHRSLSRTKAHSSFAVMFIDLDNFKVINDSLGHAAGDDLLIEVARRVQVVLRSSDTFARLGGDEFTILLDEAKLDDATMIAQRVLDALDRPVKLADRLVYVSGSIGIAMSDTVETDAHGLMRNADAAMYKAKGQGKAGYAVFDQSLYDLSIQRLELELELRTAADGGEFSLQYQPIVCIESGELREVEALLRWNNPTRGAISPSVFIPIAEETGLICGIGAWVLRHACRQVAQWQRRYPQHRHLGLSVNVSGRQFQTFGFVTLVEDILRESGLDAHRLTLEITETAMLQDLETMRGVFDELRSLGIKIAIDDFGTGYSSISYLSHLPVDTLKIDRAFVDPLGTEDRSDGLVGAMIAMARTLGLQVTSEGIETQGQLDILRRFGCDLGQGYLFSKPLTSEGVFHMLGSTPIRPVNEPKFGSLTVGCSSRGTI